MLGGASQGGRGPEWRSAVRSLGMCGSPAGWSLVSLCVSVCRSRVSSSSVSRPPHTALVSSLSVDCSSPSYLILSPGCQAVKVLSGDLSGCRALSGTVRCLCQTSCQVLSGAVGCLSDRRGALVLSGAVGAVGWCCQTLSELSELSGCCCCQT